MSARHMYWLLTAALILTAAQFAVAAGFVVIAPLVDQPLTTSLNLVSSQSRDLLVALTGEGPAKVVIDRGNLILDLNEWRAALLKVAGVIVTGGVAITVLLLLRRFVADVRDGRPFTANGAARIRTVGLLLLVLPLWQVVDAALWQGLVRALTADRGPLVWTFGTASASGETLRIMPQVNFSLVFAGLILMVIGEAFRTGALLQRDSDEIV
jgi:hypothetical protein